MKNSLEEGHFLSWASIFGEKHYLFFILLAWLACLLYTEGLSTLLLLVCVPSLSESLFPSISADQLYFRSFCHGTVLHANFIYLSSTAEAPNPQTYYQNTIEYQLRYYSGIRACSLPAVGLNMNSKFLMYL